MLSSSGATATWNATSWPMLCASVCVSVPLTSGTLASSAEDPWSPACEDDAATRCSRSALVGRLLRFRSRLLPAPASKSTVQ